MNERKNVNIGLGVSAIAFTIVLATNVATWFGINPLNVYNDNAHVADLAFLATGLFINFRWLNYLRGWRIAKPVNLVRNWAWWLVVGYCIVCCFTRPGAPYKSAKGFFFSGGGHHADLQIDEATFQNACRLDSRFLTACWLVGCAYAVAKSCEYKPAEQETSNG